MCQECKNKEIQIQSLLKSTVNLIETINIQGKTIIRQKESISKLMGFDLTPRLSKEATEVWNPNLRIVS
jgi:hypothetical protein